MDIADSVIAIVIDKLGVNAEDVTLEAKFNDLGADSLDRVELIMEIETKFEITIPDDEMEKIETVQDAINTINNKLKLKSNGN